MSQYKNMGLCSSTQSVVEFDRKSTGNLSTKNSNTAYQQETYNPEKYQHLDTNNNRRKSNFHLKSNKHDWKNTNLAFFGTDLEKQVKKEAAESETAWENAGLQAGLQIWRINNFKVEHWPKEQYGEFYNGDSYIVLNSYEEEDGMCFDVHFWIGKFSTQDEYATAAYKTVELDCFLDGRPVQHREVQNHESHLFLSYFKDIYILNGGCESGFRRVLPETYEPRLIKVKQKNCGKIICSEIEYCRENITEDDVFIIDYGKYVYLYQGEDSSPGEKFKAVRCSNRLKNERFGKCVVEIIDNEMLEKLGVPFSELGENDFDDDSGCEDNFCGYLKVFRVSDESGVLEMTEVDIGEDGEIGSGDGAFGYENLDSGDVFILNCEKEVFVWVGKEASMDERRNCISYASNYLSETDTPWLPITVVAEGTESNYFWKALNRI